MWKLEIEIQNFIFCVLSPTLSVVIVVVVVVVVVVDIVVVFFSFPPFWRKNCLFDGKLQKWVLEFSYF